MTKAPRETLLRLAAETSLNSAIRDYAAAKWEQGQGLRSERSVECELNRVKSKIRILVEAAQEEGVVLLVAQE